MFAEMRTGSNFLEANLNTLERVTCHGEVFNPHFIGKQAQFEAFGFDMAAREADPLALLANMRAGTDGLAGFRLFHDHDPRIIDAVIADPACAKIVLTRNPVESYVSWKIARETGQWKLTNPKNLKSAQATFEGPEFEAHLARLQAFQIRLMHDLQVSGQTAFYIDYDDVQDLEVLNGLAAYLGVTARLKTLDPTLKKQNPEEIGEKVENPEEMAQALARLDRFNLARTPNFEPRRAPMIPGFAAASGAGLLFMPIKGGPEDAVLDWLSRAGTGGLITDFAQKSLRQWKRATLPHRSFTVLRHPVARAHAAFCSQILGNQAPEIRWALTKAHKIAIPDGSHGLLAHRAAFLGVLRYLKLNLSGQTAQRVLPHFATQSAVIQGYAQFQAPDLLLREDSIDAGLAFLAAETGITPPAFHAVAQDAPFALADIYDEEIEAAVRDAYQRDYMGFGFDAWRKP